MLQCLPETPFSEQMLNVFIHSAPICTPEPRPRLQANLPSISFVAATASRRHEYKAAGG